MKSVPYKELAGLLGEKKAMQLCRRFAGWALPSPLAVLRTKRDDALFSDWYDGASFGELSAKYNLTVAQVRGKVNGRIKDLENKKDNNESDSSE